jgi:hypothetical protein
MAPETRRRAMDIKKMIVVCVMAIAVNMISAMPVVCAEADIKDTVSVPQVSNAIHVGMSQKELFKIYHEGDVQKFEKNGNKEILVFDDILSPDPNDTITFYLVDGKVNSWDKNTVIFPDNAELRATIHAGMSKEDLLAIYPIGNLKRYTRSTGSEIWTFNDILSPAPYDTITFQIVDGKVKKWERNSSVADVDALSAAKPDAEKTISKADTGAAEKVAALVAAAEKEAKDERKRYSDSYMSQSTDEHDIMRMKQNERRSSIRSYNWYYNGGLYYYR